MNISGRLLGDAEFADVALCMAAKAEGKICFEITETAVIENPDLALRLNYRLHVRQLCVPSTGALFAPGYPETPLEAWPLGDLTLFWERWGHVVRRGDPYVNVNFSLASEHPYLLSAQENTWRARGELMAYDRPTVERLARRFPGRLDDRSRGSPRRTTLSETDSPA